jgi:hypothetical protein
VYVECPSVFHVLENTLMDCVVGFSYVNSGSLLQTTVIFSCCTVFMLRGDHPFMIYPENYRAAMPS